jgi:inorganic pyrophosphatase
MDKKQDSVQQYNDALFGLMQKRFKSHPWHGIPSGIVSREGVIHPEIVNVFVEIVPTDTFKYEVDKNSGMLRVDRPQMYSNVCPQMYGFIPQTYCMEEVALLCDAVVQRELKEPANHAKMRGDSDPLDICVMAERSIPHGDVLVSARPIGGFRMIDKGEADDKIIAILQDDVAYQHIKDIKDCPISMIQRLSHYFLTYKLPPGSTENVCSILEIYGAKQAHEVIHASMKDYDSYYPGFRDAL